MKVFQLFLLILFSGIVSAQEIGKASYYSDFYHGRKTAYGVYYDKNKMMAAHKTLPFNTKIRVTRIDNGKYVDVLVMDRGPYIKGRIVDLSKEAAFRLGILTEGQTDVSITVLEKASDKPYNKKYETYSVLEEDRQTVITKASSSAATKPVLKSKGGTAKPVKKKPKPPHWTSNRLYQIEVNKPNLGEYLLQVGSFKSYENALVRAAQFQEMDYNDILVYFDKEYFKLFFGPFKTEKECLQEKKEIYTSNRIKSFMVNLGSLNQLK